MTVKIHVRFFDYGVNCTDVFYFFSSHLNTAYENGDEVDTLSGDGRSPSCRFGLVRPEVINLNETF